MQEKNTYSNLVMVQPQFCIARKTMMCNRLIAKIFRKHIGKHNLTTSQLSILFITLKKQVVLQSFLAEMLILEKSTISRNMRRLLEKGYIQRSQEVKKAIQLTEEGKAFLNTVIPDWENAMQEVKEILGENGQAALDILLKNLK